MNNLAKFRGKHELTQLEMAKKLGITKACISFYENKEEISLTFAKKYSEVLNENIFEILGENVFLVKPTTDKDKKIVLKFLKEID